MPQKPIDPKYSMTCVGDEMHVAKTLTGELIPDDEPLILFRGRDRNALRMLQEYRRICIADGCTPEHIAGIDNRIEAFVEFRHNHPERMKQPGITLKADRQKAADDLQV